MADGLISISLEGWHRALALYTLAMGKTLQEALVEEWPLLIRKVMDYTPPFSSGGAAGASDLSVGRAAVSRDIQKTMRPFDPATVRDPRMKKILDERDTASFNAIAARSRSPLLRGRRAVHFSPQVHTSQRNARGRVNSNLGQVVLGAEAAHLRQYITLTMAKVGIAKSGWWPALVMVDGKAPAYVTKHGIGQGSVMDERKNDLDPSLTAINRTPWATRKDEAQRIIQAATASRAVAITSKVRTKMRLAAREARLAA